jgi:hypothetical protein
VVSGSEAAVRVGLTSRTSSLKNGLCLGCIFEVLSSRLPKLRSAARINQIQTQFKLPFRVLPRVWPNLSVEARPNGKPPGPRNGLAHHPSRGPGVSPPVPPHLKR